MVAFGFNGGEIALCTWYTAAITIKGQVSMKHTCGAMNFICENRTKRSTVAHSLNTWEYTYAQGSLPHANIVVMLLVVGQPCVVESESVIKRWRSVRNSSLEVERHSPVTCLLSMGICSLGICVSEEVRHGHVTGKLIWRFTILKCVLGSLCEYLNKLDIIQKL